MIPNLKLDFIKLLQKVLRDNSILIQNFKYSVESINELQNFKLIIYVDQVPQGEHRSDILPN